MDSKEKQKDKVKYIALKSQLHFLRELIGTLREKEESLRIKVEELEAYIKEKGGKDKAE